MPITVPNWIGDAVAVDLAFGNVGPNANAYPVRGWRATKTRVMVTLGGNYWSTNEVAFRLDDLGQVGKPPYSAMYLLAPDDPRAIEAVRSMKIRRAVNEAKDVIRNTRLDVSSMSPEALSEALDAVMKACSAAIVTIAEES